MVFKVSKGGVRSGNTLRGLHSRRTKLYGRHACMIGHSSLGGRNLDSFLSNTSEENSLVGDTLKRTDVLLSLNKKQRWRVPALISQMIARGGFEFDQSSMISLLERHKLKRRANCVRYASNGGRLPNVEPKQKTYFSLSLDRVDQEESNRQKRKLKAKTLNKLNRKQKDIVVKRKKNFIKVVRVFTHSGANETKVPVPVADTDTDSTTNENKKQEYRVEVIYPCPQSCSLTFNPKYTDVVLEEGKSGNLEAKANVKAPKRGKRHHRKRLTTKDFDDIYEKAIDDDVTEMWNDGSEDTDHEEYFSQRHANRFADYESNLNYIDILLCQAKKAHKIVVGRKYNKHNKGTDQYQNMNVQKSHVVYVDPKTDNVSVNEKTTKIVESSQYLEDVKSLDFAKVILKSNETTAEFLEQKFGSLFSEASCQPRRFMINITDDVANVLSTSKSSSNDLTFISYLVFIFDGVYDDGLEVYRVIFNSYSCQSTQNLSEYLSFSQTSFDDIMNVVIGYILDLRDKEEWKSNESCPNIHMKGMYNFLYNRINLKVENFDTSNALSEIIASKNVHEGSTIELDSPHSHFNYLSSTFDQDIFCDICYDTINPTKIDAVYGTKLSKCGHHCCDTCWVSHFQSRMREGSTTMTCSGYDCSNEIGLVTLLSIVHISDIALLFQRKVEKEIERVENAKWCPNSSCGRVIKIDSSSNDLCQDVVCVCGTEVCFACFGSAHWPATCDQAKEYWEKLATLKPPKDSVEETYVNPIPDGKSEKKKQKAFEVEGRICPQCRLFISKNARSNRVTCKCGFYFCWNCIRPSHYQICRFVDHAFVFEHTRLLQIHHRQDTKDKPQVNPTLAAARPKIDNAKQKATQYQRALQQKIEASKSEFSTTSGKKSLVRKITSAAQKDLQFKREIISTMEQQVMPPQDQEEGGMSMRLRFFDIKPSVNHLIRSSQEIKGVLHHVAEFSYVLLRDTPNSVEKQRILRLAGDITGVCSFFSSVLELEGNQDAKNAFHRLLSIQEWATRLLDALIAATRRLRRC